jgi:hypothetical protein
MRRTGWGVPHDSLAGEVSDPRAKRLAGREDLRPRDVQRVVGAHLLELFDRSLQSLYVGLPLVGEALPLERFALRFGLSLLDHQNLLLFPSCVDWHGAWSSNPYSA